MLFSFLSSFSFLQSCRDENWKSIAKYCVEDLPNLLKGENLDNVQTLLSCLIESLPADAEALIKWVVEVRRKEEGGPSLSKEEKERLFSKENVLQQVRDTRLFAIVHDQQYANNPCCNCSSSSEEDSLTRIAAVVCCQGAAMLSGNFASRHGFCCSETCLKCVQANGDGLKTVISASVVSEGNEQGVDMLLPMSSPGASSCNSNLKKNAVKYPSSADVLTVLLLALHPSTWLGIKDEKLKAELQTLVSTDNLPDELKREIMHLRRQLYYLKACKEKEEDEDDDPPSQK
jgi:glutathione gamma-glutamylcysteinyltransferase